MRLVWARYALDDRDTIFSCIERENPGAAVHVDEERYVVCLIFRKAAALAGLPELESLLSLGLPYIAAYMVMADRILSVLHGAQEWPSELDDE